MANNKDISKKSKVISKIFEICKKENNYDFHNDLVKEISKKVDFGNPFDATKIDNIIAEINVIWFENRKPVSFFDV